MKTLYPLLIGSKWQTTDNIIDVINPHDRKIVTKVCRALPEHVEKVLSIAEKSRTVIASLPSYKKTEILQRVSDSILQRKEELAKTITLECGKPISDSCTEVKRAALTFKIASEEASRIGGEFFPLDRNKMSEGRWGVTRRFPCGTVFGITPFNFPLNLVAHKIAPAIASGNPIILKPASKTPVTALILGEIIMESGLPEGGLSVLPCDNKIAERILSDDRIKVLSFTGSASVGWQLKKLASDKKVLLELGGNAGVIIDKDCNLEYAVQRCVTGAFSYSGQICISVQRIYIYKDIYDDFLEMFIPKVKSLRMGNPTDESTQIAPVIDEENLLRIDVWIKEAKDKGAKVITGGKRNGNFYEPTVLLDTTPEMNVSCMEVFAPVVTVTKIDNFEEGIKAVNDSQYGLQAGVFTNNLKNAFMSFEGLEVGGVIINDIPTYRIDHMPYGGVKKSGFGREGIRYAIEEMTEIRLMVLNL